MLATIPLIAKVMAWLFGAAVLVTIGGLAYAAWEFRETGNWIDEEKESE